MNLKTILIIGQSVAIMACIALFALWRSEVGAHDVTKLALKTANVTITQYEESVKTSERINRDHQNDIDRLNASIKRLRAKPALCSPVTFPSGIYAGEGSGGGHAGKNGQSLGLSSEWLYEYAAECERLRIERNTSIEYANALHEVEKK